ncbi:MAG: hypothetical protein DRN15_04110 [Thermoprotei archaeon]|nr:MAG: hypothetical protein DRN15_04110 [Thermoprotei archaeon]RLF25945.1 MAG: hypothetical protein DRM97_00110 [Thermoprotei archaeon]
MKFRIGGRIIRCPNCGYQFSLSYARTMACSGCPLSVSGCDYVKCPRCGYEFKLTPGKGALM